MQVNRKKAEQIANVCIDRYYHLDCVQGIGITTVGIQNPGASAEEQDDYCVVIALFEDKPLPDDFGIPYEIEGVKIYTEKRPGWTD